MSKATGWIVLEFAAAITAASGLIGFLDDRSAVAGLICVIGIAFVVYGDIHRRRMKQELHRTHPTQPNKR